MVWRLNETANAESNVSIGDGSNRQGHSKSVTSIAVSQPLGRLISASRDGDVKIWDSYTGVEFLTLERVHLSPVIGLGISPDGKKAFTTIEFKSMWGFVWDVQTGKLLNRLSFRGINFFSSLDVFVVSPSGNRILAALSDWGQEFKKGRCVDVRRDWIVVWESSRADQLFTLKGHRQTIRAIGFSGDGSIAVSGSEDKRLIVWDIVQGKQLHILRGHKGSVTGVAIPPTTPIAVSTSDDATMRVWDLHSGQQIAAYSCPAGAMTGVVVSPDATMAVSANADGTLGVWNLETGAGPDWLTGHSAGINSLAISTGGEMILSASQDKTLKLWDLPTRRMIASFRGESAIICCVIVRPDLFVCGEDSGAVHFLRLEQGKY
jgi:WD40 repeat protein